MAGSGWGEPTIIKSNLDGSYSRPIGLRYEFTADDTDGTIPNLPVSGVSGFVFGIDFKKGTTPPNNLTLVMKTKNGNTQWSPAKLTDSGWRKPDSPEPIADGFILSAVQDDAKTNSAKGVVTILVG